MPDAALVQVASPSRENVEAYQQLREEVETLVGRINGEHGKIGSAAIYYLHHSYPPEEMAALYLAADVMLVTSLRDGMNLVAKEFVAACVDERGVLVLSEFTGAADELAGSILVNPHDIDGLKDAIERAARMEPREMRRRMRKLRRRVLDDDVTKWSQRFLTTLGSAHVPDAPHEPTGLRHAHQPAQSGPRDAVRRAAHDEHPDLGADAGEDAGPYPAGEGTLDDVAALESGTRSV